MSGRGTTEAARELDLQTLEPGLWIFKSYHGAYKNFEVVDPERGAVIELDYSPPKSSILWRSIPTLGAIPQKDAPKPPRNSMIRRGEWILLLQGSNQWKAWGPIDRILRVVL